jgi:phosphoenolpyruvate-protein kinase (PTS system EI component)
MRKFSPFIATITGAAILALAGYAQAFPGHGGHHGSAALAACLAAAPKSVKTSLWSTIKSSSLHTDRQAVETARQNLAQSILAKSSSLSADESALSAAQLKVIQDEDALAQNVCGQLSPTQLSAASALYTNLQNNHQTVKGYFQAAHAAGNAQ